MFKIAAKANKNNDFGQLLEMADELEIDIELSNELIDEMIDVIDELSMK